MQPEPYRRPTPEPFDCLTSLKLRREEKERWKRLAAARGLTFSVALRRGISELLDRPEAPRCATCGAPPGLLQPADDIDPGLGHWFAGFADGEGHFAITANNGGRSMCCRFSIKLRDDDEAILRELLGALDCGWITYEIPRERVPHRQARWTVADKAGCLRLVAVLDRYPLRAKKARDYELWREAVFEWCRVGGPRSGRAGAANWSRMRELQQKLQSVRAYA